MANAKLSLLQACTALLTVAAASSNYTSTLLERGTIISFDNTTDSLKILSDASILITGNRIDAIFEDSENITVPSGTERISIEGKIVSPGFVDTHRHGWQTAYKTLGSNTTLAEYFDRYGEFTKAGTEFTADDIYLGQVSFPSSPYALFQAVVSLPDSETDI